MKNKKIIIISLVFILVVLIVGISYAAFRYETTQEEENIMIAACYNITYDETEGVEIENGYPVSDAKGMKTKPYKLTMTNNCKKAVGYNVILNILEESSTPNELMKVSINSLIQNVNELEKIEKKEEYQESYKILGYTLEPQESVSYDIRSWMNEESTEGESTQFANKISVEIFQEKQSAPIHDIVLASNKTQIGTPDFSHASPEILRDRETNIWSDYPTHYGDGLFASEDNDGTSYYFRGEVYNNNVQFAKKAWKIIRVNGDGSVRLILNTGKYLGYALAEDDTEAKGAGYTYDNKQHCTQDMPCVSNYDKESQSFSNEYQGTNGPLKEGLETWYKDNLKEYDDKIALSTYCNDTSIVGFDNNTHLKDGYLFGPYQRIALEKTPSLKCSNPTDYQSSTTHSYGGVYKLKVGLLTADEISMMGFKYTYDAWAEISQTHFMLSVLKGAYYYWTTISPMFVTTSNVYCYEGCEDGLHSGTCGRGITNIPVINLKPNIELIGAGTEGNPYIVQ